VTVAPNPGFLSREFILTAGSASIVIDQAPALMSQTITFNPVDNATLLQYVTIYATASSGLTVAYTSNTPSVCAVPGFSGATRYAGHSGLRLESAPSPRASPATPFMRQRPA
jgi:hypothetical protein